MFKLCLVYQKKTGRYFAVTASWSPRNQQVFQRFRGLRPRKSFYQRCSGAAPWYHIRSEPSKGSGFIQAIWWEKPIESNRKLEFWSTKPLNTIWFSILLNDVFETCRKNPSLNSQQRRIDIIVNGVDTIETRSHEMAGEDGISSQPVLQRLIQVPLKHTQQIERQEANTLSYSYRLHGSINKITFIWGMLVNMNRFQD